MPPTIARPERPWRPLRSSWLLALSWLLACSDAPAETPPRPPIAPSEPHVGGAPPEPSAEDATEDGPAERLYLHTSLRCGECHADIHASWTDSAHARASTSPAYVAMRERAAEPDACARCHAPLSAAIPGDPLLAEGVSCDGCHTISELTSEGAGGPPRFTLRLADNVKYGPLCDAEDHYFHRMGCSELHGEARFCSACHVQYREVAGGTRLPIYTEFDEWQAGPYPSEGVDCQFCHMPEQTGEIATGAGERDDLSHHGFLAEDGQLRRRALEVVARARATGAETVALTVQLTNERAGHRVPTGMPGRQIVLEALVMDEAGQVLARDERVYARLLVDASGREVPYDSAVRLASDNRIGPRESRTENFELTAPSAGELRVVVRWRALSPAIARQLRLSDVAEEQLAAYRFRIGAPGRRRSLGRAERVEDSGQ